MKVIVLFAIFTSLHARTIRNDEEAREIYRQKMFNYCSNEATRTGHQGDPKFFKACLKGVPKLKPSISDGGPMSDKELREVQCATHPATTIWRHYCE